MFHIFVKNIHGEVVASASFFSREACLSWYKGFIYGLNPNNNESDFYPYFISGVCHEV